MTAGRLDGQSVVVTRARHQATALIEQLEAAGATAIAFPVIEIVDPPDGGAALHVALHKLNDYDWLVFTSANAVERVGAAVNSFTGSIAAIGPSTADELKRVDLIPDSSVGEALVDAFPSGTGKVLLPQADGARDVVAAGLRDKGWTVDMVTAYATVPVIPSAELMAAVANADVVTFASSSAVTAFLATGAKVPPRVACIGPVTARTAEDAGLIVNVLATDHSIAGLVGALF